MFSPIKKYLHSISCNMQWTKWKTRHPDLTIYTMKRFSLSEDILLLCFFLTIGFELRSFPELLACSSSYCSPKTREGRWSLVHLPSKSSWQQLVQTFWNNNWATCVTSSVTTLDKWQPKWFAALQLYARPSGWTGEGNKIRFLSMPTFHLSTVLREKRIWHNLETCQLNRYCRAWNKRWEVLFYLGFFLFFRMNIGNILSQVHPKEIGVLPRKCP